MGKVALIPMNDGECGKSTLASPFESISAPVSSNFVFGLGSKLQLTTQESFKVCLCPDYEAVYTGAAGPCTDSSVNFVQSAGTLILISAVTRDPETGNEISVVSNVKFNLEIVCGSGACSQSGGRIKIVEGNGSNRVPYYSDRAGCTRALQSSGYIGPSNCQSTSPTACSLSAAKGLVFGNIQLDGTKLQDYDVCYCDSNCGSRGSWFFVDTIQVKPPHVSFTVGGLAVSRPLIGMRGSIEISVNEATSFRSNGTLSREMKLLLDNSLSLTSHECFSHPQSVSVVSGHDCYTVSNCATPTTSSKRVLVFGADDIRIQQAGYISVCYCNSECTVWSNWFVAGRLLFSGPSLGQSWTVTQNLPFAVSVRGWGLAASDRIQACTTSTIAVVIGPTVLEPKILSGSAVIVTVKDAWERDVSLAGTVVQFETPHQLLDGDWIQLMIGIPLLDSSNHRVSVLDDTSILLSISLPLNWRVDYPLTPASWWRTNLETFASLLATKPGNYSLCWNGNFLGPLTVVAPPFTVGTLGLATIVPDKAGFVSLQFSTSDLAAYAVEGGYMRIVFNSLNLLEPLDRNGNSFSGESTECGSFFLEMNSLGGFSYPSNCSAIGNPRNELYIHFNEGNGMRGGDVFTFVLLGKAFPALSPVNPPNGPVQVWTMNRDGTVIEVVYLKPNRGVSPLAGSIGSARVSFDILDGKHSTDLASTSIALTGFCLSTCSPCSSDSECGSSGSTCVSPIPPACARGNITAYPSFRFTLTNGVIPGSTVRIIFSPLNDWNLQTNVLVTCSSITPPILTTVTESLVNGPLTSDESKSSGGNVLSITLPGDLDPMMAHVYSVGSVRLPRNGFFSDFFWVEIVPPDLELADPIYVRSSVGFYKRPSISTASLYVPSPLIFRGENDTLVYLKLELGVRAAYSASITVQMPKGYTCKMEMVAGCDVKRYGTRVCEFDGITPPSLSLFSTRPSGRGVLGIRTPEREFNQAGWTQDTNACILTLKTDTVVFSSSSFFLAILVDVPPTPLQRSTWSVSVLQDGILSTSQTIAGNVAVLGELRNASFHPSTLVANEWNNVFVSFATESACNGTARIVIETNGDQSCEFWGLGHSFTCLEPGVIVSSNSFLSNTNFAFSIRVRNPAEAPSMWFRVRTESRRPGEGCDATSQVIQLALYPEQLEGLNVTVSDMTPGTMSAIVRIAPIRVPAPSQGKIRITAPEGFIWNFSNDLFRFRFSGFDPLPIGSIPVAPVREPLNVFVIDNLVSLLLPGKSYGIEASVSVPVTSPTTNMFRIEVGSVAAAVVGAPLVKTIRKAAVEMETTIAGASGLICFQFETVTDLVRASQIVIELPLQFFTKMDCFFISKISTSLLPPRDAICYFDSAKSLLSVTAGKSGIPRGELEFCLSFTNPSTSSDGGRWRIYSLASNGRDYIDYPAIVRGERIMKRIGGGLEVGGFSNRRPGASGNKILFWFIADASDQSRNTTIRVRAPMGFSFEQNCSIDTNVNASFAQWPTLTFDAQCGTRDAVFYSSSPLVGTFLYGLYITGIENPIDSSLRGTWAVSINGNFTTGPIPGFDLWSFRGLKIISRDVSRGAENVTVQLQFIATSSIPPYGSILITSPSAGFTFPSPLCSASSLQVPVICTSYPLLPVVLNLTLPAGLIAGSPTEFLFTVNNPSVLTSNATSGSWKLASHNVTREVLDVGTYLGPKIVDSFTQWSLVSISTTAGGDPTVVELKLVTPIVTVGDTVEVQFPSGYVLNVPGSSKCTATIELGTCNGHTMTFPLTKGPVVVSVVTRNPSSTPRINTYIARHLRGQTVMSFGSFHGPLLIPKIGNIEIEFSAVSAGSLSRVTISFSRLALHGDRIRIGGHDMSQVTSSLPVLSRSQSEVMLNATALGSIQVCRLELINVRLPPVAGPSVWSVAVLDGLSIVQRSDNVMGPSVVGRIDVVTHSVSPNRYGSLDSVIRFRIKLVGSQLSKRDQLRLYPPSGYNIGENSSFIFDSHSLNMDTLSLRVSLPRRMDQAVDRRWRFDLVSADQELVATNDNSFPGFWLTSTLPFQVIPSSTSPSVRSDLRVVFTVPFEIRLATRSVSLQLAAPSGFVFSSAISCLSTKTSQWTSCVGSGNVATLTCGSLVVPAGVGEIALVVWSPVSTPSTQNNFWNISIYIDDDPGLIVSSDSAAGYLVKSMQAAFIGSNRLGISRVAFFTFRISHIPNTFFQVLIQPPPEYTILCDSTYHVGMKSAPICSGNDGGVPGSSVSVIVPKTEVSSVRLYAIGVTVVYPVSRPRSTTFSLIIQDSLGTTLDANTHVDGLVLDQVYVLGPSMTYSSNRPRTMSTVTVSFSVEVAINPSSIVLDGPDNYILGAATNVVPSSNLHMSSVAVKGNTLKILLTSNKGLEADKFTLSFTVMNPGTTPYNNFWVLSIFRDDNTVYYSAPMEGYLINSPVT